MLAVKNDHLLCVDALLKHPNMNKGTISLYDKLKK